METTIFPASDIVWLKDAEKAVIPGEVLEEMATCWCNVTTAA
jgi:hypothetical protein